MDAFYAVLRRDGRTAWLAGPYATKGEAEEVLPDAHELALEFDPFCHFDVPCVAKVTADAANLRMCVLNSRLAGFRRV